jgi:hypothetical protein
VPGRADASRAVNIKADVIVEPHSRLPGMDPHPHAHVDPLGPVLSGKRPLSGHRGRNCVASAREGDKERVALGVDLAAVVLVERRAQHALMLSERSDIAVAQPPQ